MDWIDRLKIFTVGFFGGLFIILLLTGIIYSINEGAKETKFCHNVLGEKDNVNAFQRVDREHFNCCFRDTVDNGASFERRDVCFGFNQEELE